MKLKNFAALCFDMDFTLVNYSLDNFVPMVYSAFAKYLVRVNGYPESLLTLKPDDYKLMRRGLILDKPNNCIIDVSSTGTVLKALKGLELLTADKIEEIYPGKQWQSFSTFTLSDCSDDFMLFDSVFVTPAIPLIAKFLDKTLHSKSRDTKDICRRFYADLLEAAYANYRPDVFAKNTGNFFPEMKRNTGLYIEKAPSSLVTKLAKLREEGIKMVLVTASHTDYTQLLMNYAFGPNWHGMFDVVCCRAKKPGFFRLKPGQCPFLEVSNLVDPVSPEVPVEALKSGSTFLEGHWSVLDKWIQENRSHGNVTDAVYIGDSFKSDIAPTRECTSWKMFAIVMEGKQGLMPRASENPPKRAKSSELIRSMGSAWHSIFGESHGTTTLYGEILQRCADVVFSDVNVLANVGLDKDITPLKDKANFYDFEPPYH